MVLPRVVLALALGFCLYAYFGYPAILTLLRLRPHRPRARRAPSRWPRISITLPVYNEAHVIAGTLERILALDYPADRRQILVISDASTDGTHEIVSSLEPISRDRGVEFLRSDAATVGHSRVWGASSMNSTVQRYPQ